MEMANRVIAGIAATLTGLSVPIVAINWCMGLPPTWGTILAALAMYVLATIHFGRIACGKTGLS